MTTRVKMSNGQIIPTDNIKMFRVMTDQDRENIKAKYGTDASGFKVQVTFADKSQKSFSDEVAKDGNVWKINDVPLVNLGGNKFVVADEIKDARELKADDIKSSGITTERTFHAAVHLKSGGQVWSTGHATQILDRRDNAVGRGAEPKPKV